MVSLKLTSIRVTEAYVRFEPKSKGSFKMENKYSLRISFSPAQDRAVTRLTIIITDTEKEQLHLKIVTEGIFSVEGLESETDRKVANTISIERMFPRVEQYIKSLASMTGIIDMPVVKPSFSFEDIKAFPPGNCMYTS